MASCQFEQLTKYNKIKRVKNLGGIELFANMCGAWVSFGKKQSFKGARFSIKHSNDNDGRFGRHI